MFIRKTKKIDPKNSREYFLFQLVESFRTERGPRQRILMNLGTDLDLTQDELKELANRIEEHVTGQRSLFPATEKVETLAQKFASQLISNLSHPVPLVKETEHVPDYQTIDIDTVEHVMARSIGCEHLLHYVAGQLELGQALRELGISSSQLSLALGSIYARAIFPASDRASFNWLQTQSGLGELLGFDFQKASLSNFYEISDLLLKKKEVLEEHIQRRQKSLHGNTNTLVLYDLTNTYMEGQARANSKAKHGYSKEKRTDCPLITLGLVLDGDGFYVRSEILPGNVSEPQTLQQAIEALHDKNQLFKPTILLDAGIASDENLLWLKENQFEYIVSARQDAPSTEVVGDLVESEKSGVRVGLVCSDSDEDMWLYCESPAKEATASQMKTLFQQRFENALQKIDAALKRPRGNKKLSKVHERIGRVKERHSRISGSYKINVLSSGDGENAIGLEWEVISQKLAEKLTGRYFLRTSLKNQRPEQLWELYQTIRTVEDAFRFMKSSLGMRPVYHQKGRRVDGHLWITILAYCLIHNLLYQLRQQGVRDEWKTIRNAMQSRIRVSTQAKTRDGKTLHARSTTRSEAAHDRIYSALNLPSKILRTKKAII